MLPSGSMERGTLGNWRSSANKELTVVAWGPAVCAYNPDVGGTGDRRGSGTCWPAKLAESVSSRLLGNCLLFPVRVEPGTKWCAVEFESLLNLFATSTMHKELHNLDFWPQGAKVKFRLPFYHWLVLLGWPCSRLSYQHNWLLWHV